MMLAVLSVVLAAEPSADINELTLRALVVNADAVVAATVASVRPAKDDYVKVELRVDARVLGSPPKTVEIDVNPPSASVPGAWTKGSRWLVFLRAGDKPKTWKTVFMPWSDLERFALEADGGTTVVRWNRKVRALPGVDPDGGFVAWDTMVEAVKRFAPGSRPATYRVWRAECEPCELEASIRPLIPPGAVDCGADAGCVLAVSRQRRPVVGRWAVQGIDSALRDVWIGDADGGLLRARFDSDISGGLNDCMAAVFLARCAAVAPDAELGLSCASHGGLETLCREADRTSIRFGEERPVTELRCSNQRGHGYGYCVVGGAGRKRPSSKGADLLCGRPRDGMMFWCEPDGTVDE